MPKREYEKKEITQRSLTISHDRINLDELLEKIKKYGLEQEWKKDQKISKE